jgi:antitoxin component of MazEF toxin-antitoxin module
MGKLRKIGPKGNSPSVTIPRKFLAELGLSNGDRVDLDLEDGSIVIRPVNIRPKQGGSE